MSRYVSLLKYFFFESYQSMLIATNEHTAIIHNSKYSCAYTHRDGEGEGEERERERERERESGHIKYSPSPSPSLCVYTHFC